MILHISFLFFASPRRTVCRLDNNFTSANLYPFAPLYPNKPPSAFIYHHPPQSAQLTSGQAESEDDQSDTKTVHFLLINFIQEIYKPKSKKRKLNHYIVPSYANYRFTPHRLIFICSTAFESQTSHVFRLSAHGYPNLNNNSAPAHIFYFIFIDLSQKHTPKNKLQSCEMVCLLAVLLRCSQIELPGFRLEGLESKSKIFMPQKRIHRATCWVNGLWWIKS